MEQAERAELIEELREVGKQFCAEASNLTVAQAKFKSAPDRWSIEECVEHVATVEKGFFKRLQEQGTPAPDATPTPVRSEAELRKEIVDRTIKKTAPETVRPTGRYGSLDAALDSFRASREEAIAYLANGKDDLFDRCVMHPRLGALTSRQAFIFIIQHPVRHLAQIREIKAAPEYPA